MHPEGSAGFFRAQGAGPEQVRKTAMHVRQRPGSSERRTCRILDQPRSTQRYGCIRDTDNEDALRLALVRLAKQYGWYGYRKMTALLRIEGWRVNHKKVGRLWREEGLQVPRRHKKRNRLYDHKHSIIRMRALYPRHIRSVDFAQDRLIHGRPYKMLTVIDEYTRQCLTVHAQFNLTSQEVLETLSQLFIQYGNPHYIRSDNGGEFKARRLQQRLTQVGVEPIYIYPGSPWENGYNERFNGALRNEVLNLEVFYSIQEAQSVIKQWVQQYNHARPRQSLNYRPPVPETTTPALSQEVVHTKGA